MSRHTDMTERLLEAESEPQIKPSWMFRATAHWGAVLLVAITVIFSGLLLLFGYQTRDVESLVLGGAGVGLAFFGGRVVADSMAQLEGYRLDALHWSRTQQGGRLDQRPGLVSTLTAADIEKYRADQSLNAAELEYLRQERNIQLTRDEAKEVRDWQSFENDKDRGQSTDHLLEKQKHELKVLEKRVRSSVDVTADELAAYEMEKAVIDAIDRESDDDKKERMIRRLDKRLYR